MNITLSIVLGIVFGSIVFIVMLYILLDKVTEIGNLKREIALLNLAMKRCKRENDAKDKDIERLMRELRYLKNNNYNYNDKDIKQIKKAIRLAMINSHPDKGGDAEDFIAFKELYNKYK